MSGFQLIITAIAGSSVLTAIIVRYSDFRKARSNRRERFINDAKFLVTKISNLSYDGIGDFRNEQAYLSLSVFLSNKVRERVNQLRFGIKSNESGYAQMKDELNSCLNSIKLEIAHLEKRWLLD